MKAKYLGRFEIDYKDMHDGDKMTAILLPEGEEFIDNATHCNWYDLDHFMRNEGTFHGIASESNSSAIGLKLDDSGDGAKLWRIW